MKGDRFTKQMGLVAKVALVSSSVALLGAACWKGVGTNTNVGVENGNAEVNTNTNSSGEIDTSDWITYANEEYGFSFRYPGDWTLLEKQNGVSLFSEDLIGSAYANSFDLTITNKDFDSLKTDIENSDIVNGNISLTKFNDDLETVQIDGFTTSTGTHKTAIGLDVRYYYISISEKDALYFEFLKPTSKINSLVEKVIQTLETI